MIQGSPIWCCNCSGCFLPTSILGKLVSNSSEVGEGAHREVRRKSLTNPDHPWAPGLYGQTESKLEGQVLNKCAPEID